MEKRISSIDFLRGLAILLMFIDHIAYFVFHEDITITNIRLITRFAEPLFVLIFALFLDRDRKSLLKSFAVILAVSLIINLFAYGMFTNHLEVLASFLVCLAVQLLFPGIWPYLVLLALMVAVDPSGLVLDYPLTVVLSQVALVKAYKQDRKLSFLMLPVFLLGSLVAPHSFNLTLLFTIPSLLVIDFCLRNRGFKNSLINFIGQRPMLFYALQYLVAGGIVVALGMP